MNTKISIFPKIRQVTILTFFVLTMGLSHVHAQVHESRAQTVSLGLNEAIDLALDQNFSIEQAGYEAEMFRARYQQTRAAFLPQLSFEYDAISTNDPLNVFGFKLKQEVVGQQDFNPALLNDPGSYENYTARFQVRQPLVNADRYLQRQAVRSQSKAADEKLKGAQSNVRYQVKEYYYNLVLHQRQLVVIESALETAGEHRRQARNFYEQGMLSKEDFLSARVYELEMESRKMNLENDLSSVREELALILGMDGSVVIHPEDELGLPAAPDLEQTEAVREMENARTRAIAHQVEAAEKMVQSARFHFLPSVNLFGTYEFNDNDFAGFDASSYMIGANLTWNLFSGYRKAGKVSEARAGLRQAQSMQRNNRLDQENRVRQALRNLNHAEQELAVTEESIRQSSEDVRIRTNRYNEGLERTTDLLEAETKLAEARLKKIMARYKYNMSIAALEMLLETNI